ncbi:hypothetical protein CVT26_014425 [Gymnopilus dilepis]|uniref:Uncharacterized protein n=1 Tax=Gymnopilus dilepis TaxID=231916 RepID=A0A409Y7Q6_9AGAR|nr:hypothetical protein CVT26_014425 [Gymnopilus dilepis]
MAHSPRRHHSDDTTPEGKSPLNHSQPPSNSPQSKASTDYSPHSRSRSLPQTPRRPHFFAATPTTSPTPGASTAPYAPPASSR